MTLLSIADSVADQTSGPKPATIAGNTNPDAKTILRIINKVGKRLMKIYGWNILRKENAFTAPGVETIIAAAAMPVDFDRFVPETFWNRAANNLLSGPISPTEWNGLKVTNYTIDNTKFIYRGGDILTNPVVGNGDACAFEYISNQYVNSAGDVGQTLFQADTDTTLLDEELITLFAVAEWLQSEGQPNGQEAKDAQAYFDIIQDNENATENISVSGDVFARNSRHDTGAPQASRTQYFGAN